MDHIESTKIFDKILQKQKVPKSVYLPQIDDPNYELCSWIQTTINIFLDNNATTLNLEAPHFNLIYGIDINACATKPPQNFIGITKGLIDYSSFIFRNFLRDTDFLNDVLGDTNDQAIIIENMQFVSWSKFCIENGDFYNPLNYSPTNFQRRKVAEALFLYYVFFTIMHEIGHLKQGSRNSIFEFENREDEKANLEIQVLEMDADIFAVNALADHLITFYNGRELPINQPYLIFFENKKTIVRCAIFILLVMFFMFSSNKKFEKYVLEYSHPHPSLRVQYSITILLDSFVNNAFLSIDEREEFGKQTIKDFRNIMIKIFPNASLKKFFGLISDKELRMHHGTLQNIAKSMKNLNGFGKY